MPKRSPIFPHVTSGPVFIPVRGIEPTAGTVIPGRWYYEVNHQIIPPLGATWKNSVDKHFKQELSASDLASLERTLIEYVISRMAILHPVKRSKLTSRIDKIRKASNALLNQLNDWTLGYNEAWELLAKAAVQGGPVRLSHDDVYPVISALVAASARALKETKQDASSLEHNAPWRCFVCRLADLFEQKGLTVTAAKSGRGGRLAKPSPLVAFVWHLMNNAVPAKVREHTHSLGSMADAISSVLAWRTKNKHRSAGRDFSRAPRANKPRHAIKRRA